MSKKNKYKSNKKQFIPTGNSIVAIKPKWQHILIIAILGFVIYSNSINNVFIQDDLYNITDNILIKNWKYFPKIFTTEYFELAQEKTYRPIVTLSYFVDYSLWKLDVRGWHFTNILFHISNSLLIYLLLILMINDVKVAFITSLLFCLHPAQTEAVDIISFREDLIALFLFLMAFIYYVKHRNTEYENKKYYSLSIIFYFFSVFTKEIAITLPVVLLLYEYCFRSYRLKDMIRYVFSSFKYWGYVIVILFLFIQRMILLKPIGCVFGSDVNTPIKHIGGSIILTMLNMLKAIFLYIKILIYPVVLSNDHVFNVSFSAGVIEYISLITIVLIIYLSLRMKKKYYLITFSVLYFFITLLPVSNIIPLGVLIAERYIYFSSIGYCLLLSVIYKKLFAKGDERSVYSRIISTGLIISILCFYSIRTYIRNKDYKDELILWTATLKSNPDSIWALNRRAGMYNEMGFYDKALADYTRAIENNPGNIWVLYNNRGLIYGKKGFLVKALGEFNKSIQMNPNYAKAYNNRGIAYQKLGEYDKALNDFSKSIELHKNNPGTYLNRSILYKYMGKPNLAKQDDEKARILKK